MDDIKIIVWIIVGLIYFFARRKKKAPMAPQESDDVDSAPPQPKPVTFEELLREIQGTKGPQPEVKEPVLESVPVRQIPDYSQKPRQIKQLEDTNFDYRDQDSIYQVYEDAKKQAFQRPSLEETVKLKDTIVRYKPFNEYKNEVKRNPAAEYRKELSEPGSFKKAFILSEILNRRF